MTTIITAEKRTVLHPVVINKVLGLAEGKIYTTYTTYENFETVAANRPQTFLCLLMERGEIDKVIQVGYNGYNKSNLVKIAEDLDIDVLLFRSME